MILRRFDCPDGILHGADPLVVEIPTGKLPTLDVGVEAGNQLLERGDLRLGGQRIGVAGAAQACKGTRNQNREPWST